ncbi:MAG: hypothetical protein ABI411_00770 [Tahibacter sp.]
MFSQAIVRPPAENFALGLTRVDLGPPDVALALRQHADYCDALRHCGLNVTSLPPDARFPDSTFVEDVAVLMPRCAVLTLPGAVARLGEAAEMRPELSKRFAGLVQITAPGSVDGGDICEAGEHVFIGISHRTNAEGARQLARFLGDAGYTSSIIDVRGIDSILHLKSGMGWLGDGRMVVIEAIAADPALRDVECVIVDPVEDYAANCVRVNDHVLLPRGYPLIAERLRALGYAPLLLDMSEFHKLDGGLSCLSLRF